MITRNLHEENNLKANHNLIVVYPEAGKAVSGMSKIQSESKKAPNLHFLFLFITCPWHCKACMGFGNTCTRFCLTYNVTTCISNVKSQPLWFH